jgi:hypothetical protein
MVPACVEMRNGDKCLQPTWFSPCSFSGLGGQVQGEPLS